MKKKLLFLMFLSMLSIFYAKETYAYDKSTYANRTLCGNFEVALFKADGTIEQKSCHSNYDEAYNAMVKDGNKDLAVLGKWNGANKIYNANLALADMTKNGDTTFDIYTSHQINVKHTYMVGGSGYGGVDAAYLATGYSTSANTFTAQIKINGYTGWVRLGNIEIVPLVWVKSSSSYTIGAESIRHNFVTKIQETYTGSSGTTIGPKPTMLNAGTYYSYDGHYFYTTREQMMTDYKNGVYTNAVNKDKPYYNYYLFLPQHTRTTYSSINIDEYIRLQMGYTKDVYGTLKSDGASRLYGKGAFFYNAQELYGSNALLALGVSRNETGNGRSNLAINKNNGFGLNAVDRNPGQAATWFPTFAQSIYDYGNSWVSYGYSQPTDTRYFGAQNGNKYVGMNVMYASDVYWGEKMASNYYFLDKAFGLQDYNYYQTAVTTKSTTAKSQPKTSSKSVFTYKSSDHALVILDEVEGDTVDGNNKWYKVVSDMNIDSNFNELTSGYYNWNSYVYVPAAHVMKINEGKNGYISPNEVPEHKDKYYSYDLYIDKDSNLQPKVAESVKDTSYYYDATLTSKTGKTLLNSRYVMVYATAYDKDKNEVAYLVTSDYFYDQKHWVSADSIKFISCVYGRASVTVPDVNTYTIVTSTTIDSMSYKISGLYHYTYVPILVETSVSGNVWYKVPVNLSGSTNIYGWTLASAPDVLITKYQYKVTNQAPVINASDKTITQGTTFDAKSGVTATDKEDGTITSKLQVTKNTVNTKVAGTYEVTYSVTDSANYTTTKTIKVTVVANQKPVINVSDKTITINSTFDAKSGVTATDKEDGTITSKLQVTKNTVNTKVAGTYEVTYSVTDSYNQTVTKTIKVTVTTASKIKKSGRFDLSYFKIVNGKIAIKGFSTIDGIDNNLKTTITYKLIVQSINDSSKKYEQTLTRITNTTSIPYKTPSSDGKDYQYSWFEGTLDITSIAQGDYRMYIEASSQQYYSITSVNNQLFNEQLTSTTQNGKYLMTRNNYFEKDKPIELLIRSEKIGDKTVSPLSNQYGQLEEIKFTSTNKLYLYGNAFSSGANLASNASVSRKIIFENQSTYQRYSYDLGATTTAKYTVKMPVDDKLSKAKAWYKNEIDISNLPKGDYSIYIQTTSNVSDIGELNEQLFRDLSKVTQTINGKKYTFGVNYNQRYRVELKVE